jgi:hypothetical protein
VAVKRAAIFRQCPRLHEPGRQSKADVTPTKSMANNRRSVEFSFGSPYGSES